MHSFEPIREDAIGGRAGNRELRVVAADQKVAS
jgi:hypothetical protein